MKLTDEGLVLSQTDINGVRASLIALKRGVVNIHANSDERINAFVRAWERLTGDDFMADKVPGF